MPIFINTGDLFEQNFSVYLFSFTLIQINLKESLINQLKCILWERKIRADRVHLHLFAIEKYLILRVPIDGTLYIVTIYFDLQVKLKARNMKYTPTLFDCHNVYFG